MVVETPSLARGWTGRSFVDLHRSPNLAFSERGRLEDDTVPVDEIELRKSVVGRDHPTQRKSAYSFTLSLFSSRTGPSGPLTLTLGERTR